MTAEPFPPGWRIVPASVAGPDHLATGAENQDALAYRRLGDGFVLAVADGAGSSSRASTGSRLAVESACDVAADLFTVAPAGSEVWMATAARYVASLLRLFDQRIDGLAGGFAVRADYATTITCVVAHPPDYLFASLGDGFGVIVRDRGGAHLVMRPDDAGPDDGAAVFLTSAARREAVQVCLVHDPAVGGVALCTDGLIEALLAADLAPGGGRRLLAPAEFERYFTAFGADRHDAGILSDQLQSEEFAATSRDDKTMLLAVRT
ncbi:protein phosphatase 2C domain-containing protein [Dactylosporangium siamense]|uniref:PPM-type phosphatase domain-containing protein n=1 Tax=Dactylosporangium siamense TaxID=685454 RepID=A0A919PUN0_9ACTN|nr:protein phosphatase 2C domain-containing protein [Dactylosporangium siamense]GIG50539.1 hypothetical protein Dsi01nite_085800 [Dactylosporangium siamense]